MPLDPVLRISISMQGTQKWGIKKEEEREVHHSKDTEV